MRSRKARQKTLGRKARRLFLPPKKQKGCRKGIPSFRSFRLSRARSPCNRLRSFPKLPKSARFSASRPFSSPNKPRSPRFYRASGCVLVYLYVQPHTGRGVNRTFNLRVRPRVRPHIQPACSAARPGCVNGCVLVYLYVQPHIGRGFGRTSSVRSTVHSPCVRPRFSCVSGCVFQPYVIRAFRCASRLCVIRAFRCAPNHTARPRNRPQLWQKVRSPGR